MHIFAAAHDGKLPEQLSDIREVPGCRRILSTTGRSHIIVTATARLWAAKPALGERAVALGNQHGAVRNSALAVLCAGLLAFPRPFFSLTRTYPGGRVQVWVDWYTVANLPFSTRTHHFNDFPPTYCRFCAGMGRRPADSGRGYADLFLWLCGGVTTVVAKPIHKVSCCGKGTARCCCRQVPIAPRVLLLSRERRPEFGCQCAKRTLGPSRPGAEQYSHDTAKTLASSHARRQ